MSSRGQIFSHLWFQDFVCVCVYVNYVYSRQRSRKKTLSGAEGTQEVTERQWGLWERNYAHPTIYPCTKPQKDNNNNTAKAKKPERQQWIHLE